MTSRKSDSPITLVVRRGAVRRFNKLQKDAAHLPVVVTWDRRAEDQPDAGQAPDRWPAGEDRRRQASFTWELADFVVVSGDGGGEEQAEAAEAPPTAQSKMPGRR